MAFDDLKAEIGLLLTRMQEEPEDRHQVYLQLSEKLNELKAYGLPIPDDLRNLEAALDAEFVADAEPQDSPTDPTKPSFARLRRRAARRE